jgi:hypothetical protein
LYIAGEGEFLAVGGGEVDIEHLDGAEFIDQFAHRQPWRFESEFVAQARLHAVCQERDEEVGLDPVFALVINRAYCQVVLQAFESCLYFHQLEVKLPEFGRLGAGQIRPQQVAAFSAAAPAGAS